MLLGDGSYSTEDISMPGRAHFTEAQIPLKSKITIMSNTQNEEIFSMIQSGADADYTVTGILTA